MRRGASVQGINSAATLWAAAAMGLAIGGGYYALGTLITAVILSARPR
jgi:putative Mg2+ transporter-C (MgtC) family protein